MTKRGHKANVHGAAVGSGGLTDQMARRQRKDGEVVGGEAVNSTSIFDPVLAELLIRWFSPPAGVVLDPFAGGSVRGIVASRLGREYHGLELREEQVSANRQQAASICRDGDPHPTWYEGDSAKLLQETPCGEIAADFVFTCPPYFDLEKYSHDPRDISNMNYRDFMLVYGKIMGMAVRCLKPDRFFAIVIGDVRDKTGAYVGLQADTVKMLQSHGLKLWNEQVLVTPAGSLPGRTKLGFTRTRKTGRSHQVCYVFLKGDPVKATQACGACEFGANDPLADITEGDDDPLAGLGRRL